MYLMVQRVGFKGIFVEYSRNEINPNIHSYVLITVQSPESKNSNVLECLSLPCFYSSP